MSWLFFGMTALSLVFSLITKRVAPLAQAAVNSCTEAVELSLQLAGIMALWSGLMKIAEKSDLTGKLSRIFRPVLRFLFPGLDADSSAAKAVVANLSANLLGLGNAATPLGIAAMKELEKQAPRRNTASDHMVMLVVLNTASLQLIPTTTAALRLAAGSADPMEILPACWLASAVSITAGVCMAKLLSKKDP